MDIECKNGRHFNTIEALKQCSNGFIRCSVCFNLPATKQATVLMICPYCFEKSLYVYNNQSYYECLNDKCLNHHVKIAYRDDLVLKISAELNQDSD